MDMEMFDLLGAQQRKHLAWRSNLELVNGLGTNRGFSEDKESWKNTFETL